MPSKLIRFLFIICIVSISYTAFAQQEFKSPYWGIMLTYPDSWMSMSNEETEQNFEEHIKLDSNYARAILESKNKIPLFTAVQQRPGEKIGVIATIKIAAHANPATNFDEFSRGMNIMFGQMFKIFKNGKYLVTPRKTTLGIVPAIYSLMTFTVESQDDGAMQVCNRVYCIPMKEYFIMITMMYAPGDKETAALYEKITQSIQLNPAKYMK